MSKYSVMYSVLKRVYIEEENEEEIKNLIWEKEKSFGDEKKSISSITFLHIAEKGKEEEKETVVINPKKK